MRFLSYDGILAQIIRYLWNLLLLNVCFAMCCLPLFTIGASVTALYSVFLNRSVESSVIRRFFHAFRNNFLQATKIWMVFLFIALLLGLDFYYLNIYSFSGNSVLRVVTILVTVVYLSVVSFVFPLQAHYDNTPGRTMKNALILGLSLILVGILMTAVAFFPVILFFLSLDVFFHTMGIWVPVGFAMATQINSMLLRRIFRKLQPETDSAQTEHRLTGESDQDDLV